MTGAVVWATGRHLPGRVVRNEDLAQFPSNALRLIEVKTGVRARRVADEGQCTSDLAVEAARSCLEKAGVPPHRLDALILSTSSPDRMQPATATRVQHRLGAERAFAFDINSVCAGGVFGLSLAHALIRAGACRSVLLVAAEMYSRILNPRDFSTFPFFGDGAGAVLLCAGEPDRGVLCSRLRTDGAGAETICVPGGGTMLPFAELESGQGGRSPYFKMDGKAVFEFAVSRGTEVIRELLDEAGVGREEVRCFLCHQANVNILRRIAENLSVPFERFIVNLDRYGNTASASVLIALDEALESGALARGDLAVTVAFGGGLSWGANLLRM